MSYILTLRDRPEGVFSVVDEFDGGHIIPIFDNKDDIVRYHEQLLEDTTNPPLQVIKVPM